MLPFSDAKEGPLSTLTLSGQRTMTTYAHGLELAQDAPAQAIEKGLDGAKATLEREPVQKVDLTSGGGKKEGSESGGSGEGSSGKQVIIQLRTHSSMQRRPSRASYLHRLTVTTREGKGRST